MKVIIAMPMYNEELDIGNHLAKLIKVLKKDYAILILDDGSKDKSVEIVKKFAKKAKIILVQHEVNQGLSTTLNDIFKETAKRINEDDVVVTMDADDTHDPKYIEEMVKEITLGYNFVVASRFQKGSKELGYPKYKIFLSGCINMVLKILFPVKKLRDYTTGYRAYRGSIIKNLVRDHGRKIITAKGFAGLAETLIKMRKYGLKVKEIPLVYRYDLKKGLSKLKLWITLKEYSKLIIKAKLGLLK
ncbi:glycosyltransferase [Candidatus Woesearchaeota archaeon]|nr:glycosyltransferase [Candidatus Woesearchaeota archaeon]